MWVWIHFSFVGWALFSIIKYFYLYIFLLNLQCVGVAAMSFKGIPEGAEVNVSNYFC